MRTLSLPPALALVIGLGSALAAPPDLPPERLAEAAETTDPEVWKRLLFDVSGTRLANEKERERLSLLGGPDGLRLVPAPRVHLGATRGDFAALVERFLAGPCRDDASIASLFVAIAKRLEVDIPPAARARLGAPDGQRPLSGELLGLASRGETQSLAALTELSKSGDAKWSSLASRALGNVAADRVEAAEKLLRHPKADVRQGAIARLVTFESFDSGKPLVAALSDRSDLVRLAAVRAVRTLLIVSAEPRLREMALAKAESADVRRDAVGALAEFALPVSLPAFLAAIEAEDDRTARHGLDGLARLGQKSAAPRVAALLAVEGSAARRAAIETLGRLGSEETQGDVRPFLESPDVDLRRTAIDALSRLSNRATDIAAFVRLLDDIDVRIRVEAWNALLRLGRDEAVAEAKWFLERGRVETESLWHLSLLLHEKGAKRLRDATLSRDVYEGSIGNVVAALEAETRVEIEINRPVLLLSRGERRRIPLAPGERRLSSALLALDPYVMAVIATEGGGVRLVDRKRAESELLAALPKR